MRVWDMMVWCEGVGCEGVWCEDRSSVLGKIHACMLT